MSLQVWLPFTDGTLKQQGLNSETVTSGGTIDLTDAGKLGKCATFGSAAGGITIPASTMTSFTNCSVAFWLKINDWGSSYDTYFQAGTGSTPWNNYIFGFLRNNTNSTICFTISNGSSASNANYLTSALSINTWYHIALTYETGKCKIYLNGALDHEYSTTIVPAFDKITKITLGRCNNDSSYQTQCSINDFRIYDHTLSQMEIKELSKGLVLHYPLNRGGWGQENYAENTGVSTSTTGTVYSLSSTIPTGAQVTISCYIDADNIVMSENKRIGLSSSQTKTDGSGTNWFECWASYSNGLLKDNGSFHGWVSNTTILPGPMSSIGAYIQNLTSGTVTISKVKVELGDKRTPWCPNSSDELATTMGLNSTIEYDCSGFCNNGNKMTNTMTYNSDTAKYQVSTHFNGTYDGILIENLQLSDIINTAVTYAFWIKPEGESGARSVYFGSFSGISWSIEKTTGNVLRLYWDGSPDETCSGATITDGVWQHICITKNGTSNVRVYINGVQKWTSTATHSALTFPTTYRIGRDTRSNDGTPYKGLMSDFRIYATALSADDVKSLYQNSAYIDSSSNVYGAIHNEV